MAEEEKTFRNGGIVLPIIVISPAYRFRERIKEIWLKIFDVV